MPPQLSLQTTHTTATICMETHATWIAWRVHVMLPPDRCPGWIEGEGAGSDS